ncbi:MAG: hypothetical protein N3B12_08240 [Armatimonadetes bacterium]|nr:hypothetical protein [Armatimonadota bacterium]
MRRVTFLLGLCCMISILASACAADGPPVSTIGKLFGVVVPPDTFSVPNLVEAYDKSRVTASFVDVSWGECQPNDPGSEAPTYDFTAFDTKPLAKSEKVKVCRIDLANPWADKIKAAEPERYWRLAEGFVTEFVKHANAMRIYYFIVRTAPESPEGSVGLTPKSAEHLKLVYKAAKAVSQDNLIIAEQPYGIGADAVEMLYKAGAKGSFDAAAVRAVTKPTNPIDPFIVVAAHREMARMGDSGKRLLIIGGCEPASAPKNINWEVIRRAFIEDYRNLLTERDIYDPAWVLGEMFYLPDKPSAEFFADFPPELPEVALQASIVAEKPIFAYVAETPYNLSLKITAPVGQEIKINNLDIALRGNREIPFDWKPEGEAPKSVSAGQSATANFTITLPQQSVQKQVTLVAKMYYAVNDKSHVADAWLTLIPTPKYEVTILPARLILKPGEESKQVGMSIINHTDEPFEGKINLSPYPGISVKPTEFVAKIDPLGLEGFAYSVSAEKDAVPGHYAIWMDVGGKAKEWQAVDVALVAKKASRKIIVDAVLSDWNDAADFNLVSSGPEPRPQGRGWIAYNDTGLYLALELSLEAGGAPPAQGERRNPPDSLFIGLDPLINGARSAVGGYRDDDYEFEFTSPDKGDKVKVNQASVDRQLGVVTTVQHAYRTDGAKLYYEILLPWSEVPPLKPDKGTSFAMAIQKDWIIWGGGLGDRVDPRLFLPVVLAE